MLFRVLPLLLLTACSAILVPGAASSRKDGYFGNPSPFWIGGGGGGGGHDSGSSTWTTTWTSTDDTGGTSTSSSTSGGDCPFGNVGDSIELGATYNVSNDECGFGQEVFEATELLTCQGAGYFTAEDVGFLSTTIDCYSDGLSFSCAYEGSFYVGIYGSFRANGTKVDGTWSIDQGCVVEGDFSWQ